MPNVITDTSPIQYLYQADLIHLLPALYGNVLVPQAVVDELGQGRSQGVNLPDLTSLTWLKVVRVEPSPAVPRVLGLGLGEWEAITLAATLPDTLVILDDALARKQAHQLNLKITGTLGVILKAKQSNLLDTIEPSLTQLDTLGFRLDATTRTAALKLAGEDQE